MKNETSGKTQRICAIYARVSKEELTLDHQINSCKNYSSQENYRVADIYADKVSGTKSRRPELNRLLNDMRTGKFNVVVIWKLDRLGRSLQHLLRIVDEFKKYNIDFVCVSQNIDTSTASGNFTFHILGAVAEFERTLISERTKEGLKNAKNVGKRGKDKKPRRKSGYYMRWQKRPPMGR